jgi:hypothetical protein
LTSRLFHDPAAPPDSKGIGDELAHKVHLAVDDYLMQNFPALRAMHLGYKATLPPPPPVPNYYETQQRSPSMSAKRITNPGQVAFDRALTRARQRAAAGGELVVDSKLLTVAMYEVYRDSGLDESTHQELTRYAEHYRRPWSDSPEWGRHDHPDLDETKDFGKFETILDRAHTLARDKLREYSRHGDGASYEACLSEAIGDILLEDNIVDMGWVRSFAAWCKKGHGISVSLRHLTNVVKTIDHAYGPGRHPTSGVDMVGPETTRSFRLPIN